VESHYGECDEWMIGVFDPVIHRDEGVDEPQESDGPEGEREGER
jgi:hypothetical protein